MVGEWCYFGKYFSKERCNNILNLALQIPAQGARLGTESIVDNRTRRSAIRFIQKTDSTFDFLFKEMWILGLRANDDFFNFHLAKLDFLQVAEYSEEDRGEYMAHHDVFWMNGDPKYHRKITCVVQLSDPADYDGGNLEIYNTQHSIDIDNRRSQGTVIFFPSFYTHAVTPVTRGKRYSLTAWFDGPKWR